METPPLCNFQGISLNVVLKTKRGSLWLQNLYGTGSLPKASVVANAMAESSQSTPFFCCFCSIVSNVIAGSG